MTMSFSDLFRNLSPAGLDPAARSFTHRNQSGAERRGRKRKAWGDGEQFENEKAGGEQLHQKKAGGKQLHQKKAGGKQLHQKKAGGKQLHKKKEGGELPHQKEQCYGQHNHPNQHNYQNRNPKWPKRGGMYRNGGRGRGRGRDNTRRDVGNRPRFMTQDFMEQNVVQVDGHLLCKHFLMDRCTKGEDCQLEHVQGYNDLFKQSCKFYIQGFCLKGDSCPFMHQSIPCKFFHRKANCSQGTSCRFSHEPLTELTEKLLETLLKREHEQLELARSQEAAQQEAAGLQAAGLQAAGLQAAGLQAAGLQAAGLQAAGLQAAGLQAAGLQAAGLQAAGLQAAGLQAAGLQAAETEILLLPVRPNFYNSGVNAESLNEAQETSDKTEEVPPPSESEEPTDREPVCYSVEAVLGAQLYKPFPGLFTSRNQSASRCPEAPAAAASRSEALYSVSSVLRSWKSDKSSSIQTRPSLPAESDLCDPKTSPEDVSDLPLSSRHNEKLIHRDEANKPLDKVCRRLAAPPLNSGDQEKQCGHLSLRSGPGASRDIQPEVLELPGRFIQTNSREERPVLPVRPGSTGSCWSSELQSGPAGVESGSSVRHRLPVKPLMEIQQVSRNPPAVLRLPLRTSQESNSRTSPAWRKESSFFSLFSKSVADGATAVRPQTDVQLKTSERDDEAPPDDSRSFLHLFAAPLRSEAASDQLFNSSHSQSRTSTFSRAGGDVAQRPSRPASPPPSRIPTASPPTSRNPAASPPPSRIPTVSRPTSRIPTASPPPSRIPTASPPPSRIPMASPPPSRSPGNRPSTGGPALLKSGPAPGDSGPVPAFLSSTDSVLKTLFVSLSPFKEEVGGQSGVQLLDEENETRQRMSWSAQQQTCEDEDGGTERLGLTDAAAASSLIQPNSDTQRSTSDPPPVEKHTSLPVQSDEGGRLKEKPAATSLKGLFQTFDTSMFHSGH